jgi:hypothetical protein
VKPRAEYHLENLQYRNIYFLVIEVNVIMRFIEETWTEYLKSSSSPLFGGLMQKIINNVSV